MRERDYAGILNESNNYLDAAVTKVIARVQRAREVLLTADLPYITDAAPPRALTEQVPEK